MKVLILGDRLGGQESNLGGSEVYDKRLAKMLSEEGHETELLGGKEPTSRLEKMLKMFFTSYYSFKWKNKIENKIEEFQPDIIFDHVTNKQISPSYMPIADEKNIPIVMKLASLNQYSLYFKKHSLSWLVCGLRLPKRLVHRRFLRKYVNIFIAPSKYTKNHIKGDIGIEENRTELIRNPIFWEPTEKINISKDKKTVIFVGSLSDQKGIETLIKSFSKLDGKDYLLKIVGNGPKEEKIKKLVEKENIGHKVEFKGYLTHKKVKNEYKASDLCVLPSKVEENSPLVPVEAMSQGLPVIITNMGGQKELVKDGQTGLLVEPGKPTLLARKIEEVFRNKDKHKNMMKEALDFSKKFSRTQHKLKIEKLFSKSISKQSIDEQDSRKAL